MVPSERWEDERVVSTITNAISYEVETRFHDAEPVDYLGVNAVIVPPERVQEYKEIAQKVIASLQRVL